MDIINLVGMTFTGGLLTLWATKEFGPQPENEDEHPVLSKFLLGCFDLYDTVIYHLQNLFHTAAANIEEEWSGYVTEQDLPKVRPGKYEVFI